MCRILLALLILLQGKGLQARDYDSSDSDYVTVNLMGQLGNQMFQIAAAYTYALDHDLPLIIPNLKTSSEWNISYNAERIFLPKISSAPLPSSPTRWSEPTPHYRPIPFIKNIELFGWLQSEKYFKHRRTEILELFAPSKEIKHRIIDKYPILLSDKPVIGVQIRDYRPDQPNGLYHPNKTRDYYAEAMEYFPEDAIFMVSSNNIALAKECTEGLRPNIIYLRGEDYIEEFYTLTLCKSFIIGNSSFGWWASWLSDYDKKIVITPKVWFAPPFDRNRAKDIYPEGCIIIDH
jgi:hypothetical protein